MAEDKKPGVNYATQHLGQKVGKKASDQVETKKEETPNNPTEGSKEELDQMVRDTQMSLPELADFEEGAVDMRIYEELAKKMGDSKEQALFYKENPPLENTGIDRLRGLAMVSLPPSAFRITDEDLHAGFVDGDTLYADLRKAEVKDPELLEYLCIGQQNMRAWLAGNKKATEDVLDANKVKDENRSLDYDMGFRFLFYDAPEVHHWSIVYATDVKQVTYGEAVQNYQAFLTKAYDASGNKNGSKWERYKDSDTVTIAQIGEFDNKWIQVNNYLTERRFGGSSVLLNGRKPVFGLMADGTNYGTLEVAYAAANDVVNMVKNAQEVRAVIDINGSSKQDQTTAYPKNMISFPGNGLLANYFNTFNKFFTGQDPTVFQETGINAYGLEHYRRNLAVIFVKDKDGQWINLNKYIIARHRNTSILKYSDFTNPHLKPWAYQYDTKAWTDAVWNATSQYDNRHEIQNKAFGWNNITKGLNSISDWTCTIGDVTLFVPPISINTVTQAYTNSVPLLRAKGSANIENAKPERFLQLELYFNEDRGINGQPVEWYTNLSDKKKKVVYHMNGFRALLSEFHFAPYMPIENKYINEVLDIDAICFESMSVATVPNYPKLLKVTLLLKEFDYQVFMPQVPKQRDLQDGVIDIYRNFFAKTINYDLLRWYIQRPLQLGQDLHDRKMNISSKDFMKKTLFANRSAYMPVDTLNPRINIYMPDEGKLVKMEKVRQTFTHSNNKAPNYYRPSEKDKELFAIANQYYKTIRSDQINNILKKYKFNYSDKASVMSTAGREIVDYLRALNIPSDYSILEKHIDVVKSVRDYALSVAGGGQAKPQYSFDEDPDNDYLKIKIIPAVDYNSRDESLLLRQQFVSTLTSGGNQNMSDNIRNTDQSGIDLQTGYYDMVFADNAFNFRIVLKQNNGQCTLEYSPYDGDSKFLEYCASQFAAVQNADGSVQMSGNQETYENYEDSEFERIGSVQYVTYLEDVLVQGLTANFSNTYANMTLNTYHGQAPQFMGGQDATLTFSVMTYDRETVDRFDKIPKIISYFKKKYPNALPSYPFRIDSEFTRLLGIFEVIVEQVSISTVVNYPGLYQINVTLRQTDRTIRNRFAIYKQFEQNNFASKEATAQRAAQAALGYFEIDQNLSKAELYPDLELPTIKELGELGFEFIRYKNPRDQVFVDPDFYFFYHEHLFSELLRDCILQDSKMLQMFAKPDEDGNPSGELKVLSDLSEAAQYSIRHGMIAQNGGISEMTAKDWQLTQDKLNQMKKEENEQRMKLFKSGIATGQWKVGKSIGVTFLEPYYAWLYHNLNTEEGQKEVEKAKEAVKENTPDGKGGVKKSSPGQGIIDPRTQVDRNSIVYKENKEEYDKAAADAKAKEQKAKENATKANENALKSVIVDSINVFQWEADKALKFLAETCIEDEGSEEALIQYFKNIIVETKSVDKTLTSKWDADINDWLNKFAWAALGSGFSTDLEPEKAKSIIMYLGQALANGAQENGGQYGLWGQSVKLNGKSNSLFNDLNYNKDKNDDKKGDLDFNVKNFKPTRYTINGLTYVRHLDDTSEFYNYGSCTELGPYGIPCFAQKEFEDNPMLQFLPIDYNKRRKKFLDKGFTFEASDRYYFLDPYYQTSDHSETIQYMKNCMHDMNYAKHAFLRNVLYWLCVLIKKNIYPNYMTDIMFQNAVSEASAYEFMKDMKLANDVQEKNVNTLKNFVKDNQDKFVKGKLFVATALSLMCKDSSLIKKIITRDYNALNALTHKVITPNITTTAPLTNDEVNLRKLLYGLVLSGLVEKIEELGIDIATDNPIAQIQREFMQQLELEANAMTPKALARRIRDSYLNMVQTDVRGRMLRGFPTFQIMFIDEGASSGFWKMHDSFYSTNAVSSIQVVKSKNIAADTAIIQLNNLYQNILAEYEDDGQGDNFTTQLQYGVAGIQNLYDSIFNPRTYVRNLSEKQALIPERNSIKLVAGARMHIRMGYSADAAKLPIMFNGTVTEIQGGDVVSIVGQGDGIELSNPIREDNFGDKIKNRGVKYLGESPYGLSFGGVSPRVLVSSFLTCQDQNWFSQLFREKNWNVLSRVFSNNPFGIYHYGDPYYRDIFVNGEPVQNIYEVTNDSSAHYYNFRKNTDITNLFNSDSLQFENGASEQGQQSWYRSLGSVIGIDPPEQGHQFISIKTQGRTVWDILQFAASANPSYIGATDYFGFRSTVFMGLPNWYYAYKYIKNNNQLNILEKRKPYSQFHMYWSDHDILSNQIQTNSNKVATVARGMYQFEEVKKSTPDIYFDRDIYPEYQRSMVVDTWLHGRTQIHTSSENTFGIDSEIGSLDSYATVTGAFGSAVGGVVGARGGSVGASAGFALGGAIGTGIELGLKNIASWAISNFVPDNYGGPEHNHAQTARLMTLSRLKKSVEQIYSGNLVVYGDPTVKPHDRISIFDEPSSMTGQARVREVVHTLSATTGFVTTITPDAIVDVLNDKTTQAVNMAITSTLMRWAVYALGVYNLQRAYIVRAIIDDGWGLFARAKGWAAAEYADKAVDAVKDMKRNNAIDRIVKKLENKQANLKKVLDTAKESGDAAKIAEAEARLAVVEKRLARFDPIKPSFTFGDRGVKGMEGISKILNSWAEASANFEKASLEISKKVFNLRMPEFTKLSNEADIFKTNKDSFVKKKIEELANVKDLDKFDRGGKANLEGLYKQQAEEAFNKEYKKRLDKLKAYSKETQSLIKDVQSINNTKKGQETLAALKAKPDISKKIIDATSKDILMKSKAGALFNRIAGTRLGRYLSSALNFGSKIGGNVLMVAAAYTLGRWGDMISDFIQNYKTLSVTPLLKRGMPFIPAWAGNSGTIFMSPNWGKRGQVLDLMDTIFNHRFQDQEGYHPIAGSLSFLLNASMGGGPADALQRYELNADGNMYANNMGGDYEYLVNQNYVDGLLQRGSIRSVEQLLMRNNEENQKDKQEIKMRAEQFMHKIEDVQKDNTSILDPLVPVPGPEFDIFKQFKFFVVRHEKALNNEESKNTVEFSINQGGKPVKVIGIKGKDGDGNEIVDAPLLHPFALNTLRKIIFQAEQMLSYKTTTDQNTYINKVSNDYITLTSCYLFGTKKIFPGSGFGFTLIAHGESKENLKVIMDTLKEKDEITYQVYDNDDGKVYQVNVNIPKFGV